MQFAKKANARNPVCNGFPCKQIFRRPVINKKLDCKYIYELVLLCLNMISGIRVIT